MPWFRTGRTGVVAPADAPPLEAAGRSRYMSYSRYNQMRGVASYNPMPAPFAGVAPIVGAGLAEVQQTPEGLLAGQGDLVMAMGSAAIGTSLLGGIIGGLFGGSWKAAGTGAVTGAMIGEGFYAAGLFAAPSAPPGTYHPQTLKAIETVRWVAGAAAVGLGYWTYKRFRKHRRR